MQWPEDCQVLYLSATSRTLSSLHSSDGSIKAPLKQGCSDPQWLHTDSTHTVHQSVTNVTNLVISFVNVDLNSQIIKTSLFSDTSE